MNDEYRDNLYTPSQSRVLTIIPMVSAPMSVVGSSLILYIILSDRKRKLKRVYHRLLLAYSFIDIIYSTNLALSATVVPRGTPGVWGALGNRVTCEASGFISQFGLALGIYSSFICVYYMLILRYDVREVTIARRIEPLVHLAAFIIPVIFGSTMIFLGMYNPTNVVIGWCFINVLPMDCLRREEVECQRGENYSFWLIFHNGPFFIFYLFVLVSSILTYLKVRNLEQRSTRWLWNDSHASTRTKESARQASLYIMTYIITYGVFGISTLGGPGPATEQYRTFYFVVVTMVKIFLPLQGFWNCFIFMRPRYAALKRRSPTTGFLQIMGEIVRQPQDNTRKVAHPNRSPTGVTRGCTHIAPAVSEVVVFDNESTIGAADFTPEIANIIADANAQEPIDISASVTNMHHHELELHAMSLNEITSPR